MTIFLKMENNHNCSNCKMIIRTINLEHKSITCSLSNVLLQVRVYQVLSPGNIHGADGNRLLDVRRMSLNAFGWEVFYVKHAVSDWIKDPNKNYG